jgi:hypothetical protein
MSADWLGLSWYDDVMGYLQTSRYAGDLINNVTDLRMIEGVATQGGIRCSENG